MATLQFDPNPRAVINPRDGLEIPGNCPQTVVTCFPNNLVDYALQKYGGEWAWDAPFANMKVPLYRTKIGETIVGLTMTFQSAPNSVSQYESLFALGAERILVFGTCGVLDRNIGDCAILIPDRAVRDEGTSFHYAPPGDEIDANVGTVSMLKEYFTQKGLHAAVGKTWTTDAFFRETRDKVAERQQQGCMTVEMECSALAALAQFRRKKIAQFFYAADNLDQEIWDERSLANDAGLDAKFRLMDLALELGAKWERGEV